MKDLKYFLLSRLFVPIGSFLFRLWRFTLRIHYHNKSLLQEAYDSGQGIIFVFWHGDIFGAACVGIRENRKKKIFVLTSQSRDGELVTRFAHMLGFGTVRGSSSRGSLASFRGLQDKLVQGQNTALTLDGSRGPLYNAKPGAVMLAKTSGAVIVPGAIRYSLKITMNSWDRFEIPLPLSRCEVKFGKPVVVPRTIDRQELDRIRKSLESLLRDFKGAIR